MGAGAKVGAANKLLELSTDNKDEKSGVGANRFPAGAAVVLKRTGCVAKGVVLVRNGFAGAGDPPKKGVATGAGAGAGEAGAELVNCVLVVKGLTVANGDGPVLVAKGLVVAKVAWSTARGERGPEGSDFVVFFFLSLFWFTMTVGASRKINQQ